MPATERSPLDPVAALAVIKRTHLKVGVHRVMSTDRDTAFAVFAALIDRLVPNIAEALAIKHAGIEYGSACSAEAGEIVSRAWQASIDRHLPATEREAL